MRRGLSELTILDVSLALSFVLFSIFLPVYFFFSLSLTVVDLPSLQYISPSSSFLGVLPFINLGHTLRPRQGLHGTGGYCAPINQESQSNSIKYFYLCRINPSPIQGRSPCTVLDDKPR